MNYGKREAFLIIIVNFHAAIAGVAAYNNYKLKKEASRDTSDASEHDESSQRQQSQPLPSR